VAKREPRREALWLEVERELRRFVRLFDTQPEWLWEPATVQLIRAVRPTLKALDEPRVEEVPRGRPTVYRAAGGKYVSSSTVE
jgi:hypothetical protein